MKPQLFIACVVALCVCVATLGIYLIANLR
jgi:hypothetical protein